MTLAPTRDQSCTSRCWKHGALNWVTRKSPRPIFSEIKDTPYGEQACLWVWILARETCLRECVSWGGVGSGAAELSEQGPSRKGETQSWQRPLPPGPQLAVPSSPPSPEAHVARPRHCRQCRARPFSEDFGGWGGGCIFQATFPGSSAN